MILLTIILVIILSLILQNRSVYFENFTGIPFRSPFSSSFYNYSRKKNEIGITNKRWIPFLRQDDHIHMETNQIKLLSKIKNRTLDAAILSSNNLDNLQDIKKLIEVGESYAVLVVPHKIVPPISDASDIKKHYRVAVGKKNSDTHIIALTIFKQMNLMPRFVFTENNNTMIEKYKQGEIDCIFLLIPKNGDSLLKTLSKTRESKLVGFRPINNGHMYNIMPEHEKIFYKNNKGLHKSLLDIISLTNKYPHLKINKGGRSKVYVPTIKIKYYIVSHARRTQYDNRT
jgi:5-bromo-4-chloroindolyl phosphate hydrolysis protein